MAKVTSKLQLTLPRQLARRYGIEPGDQIAWEAAGAAIRVVPVKSLPKPTGLAQRLRWFDEATERQRQRDAVRGPAAGPAGDRGWTRDELYDRNGSG